MTTDPDPTTPTAPTGDSEVATVARSAELTAPVGPGLDLVYQTFGDPSGEPLLLVMGLGGPMTWWDTALCEQLARRGFYVIRYDNRDTGRSFAGEGTVTRQMLVRAFTGLATSAPYSLFDMARDGFGLLDHLGLASVHVAGVSMGGMIAQTMAVGPGNRVRSLTSIMSTTGRRRVGWQSPRLIPSLLTSRYDGRDSYIRESRLAWERIGSPAYPEPPEASEARAAETWDRGVNPAGVMRQMLAVVNQPDRTQALRRLRVPTTVIHGTADPMVHVSGGRATAAAVPGAQLLLIPGMGHDLPPQLHDTFSSVIQRTAERA